MDPLSAAANIITLLQLTHKISILCWDIHSRVKSARRDTLSIIDEVKSLRTILEALAGLASKDGSQTGSDFQNLDALTKSDGVLTKCKAELEDLERMLQKVIKPGPQSQLRVIPWIWKEADIARRLESISRLKGTIQFALALDQTCILLESRTNILSLRHAVDDASTEQLRRLIMDWLGAPSPASNFRDAQKLRSPSTGLWFLNSPEYEYWTKTPRSFLWLHGIPGSGKTVLCSTIIERLMDATQHTDDSTVLYFFFDFCTQDKQAVSIFLRSLLAQLLVSKTNILEPIRMLYTRYHAGLQDPSDDALLETLCAIIKSGEETYIVIDAIDECIQRESILEVIEEITHWQIDQLHILATSRGEKDFDEFFGKLGSRQCKIQAKDDIKQHVERTIAKDPRLSRWAKHIQIETITTLISKAGEMFRWADCQLQVLKKCKTVKDLRKTLDSLPATLDDTYLRILDGIDPMFAHDAYKMLSWLCFAKNPLSLEEMTEALAVDVEELRYDPTQKIEHSEDILSICGSLVTCSNNILRLSHYSVKEYLMSSRLFHSRQATYHMDVHAAHTYITKVCLVYMRQCEDWWETEWSIPSWNPPLALYVLNFWSIHYAYAGETPELTSIVLSFLDRDRSDGSFLHMAWIAANFPDGPRQDRSQEKVSCQNFFLYHAALVACPDLINILLHKGADINAVGGGCGTPLIVAAWTGNRQCVELLLSRGAHVNMNVHNYGNALHVATAREWPGIVKLLISHGANVNDVGGRRHTALLAAVHARYAAVELVKILLDAGADPNLGAAQFTPLSTAALHANAPVLSLLLERGVDPDEQEGLALQSALVSGHTSIVDILIAKGARVDIIGGPYGSAVRAALKGGVPMLRYMVEKYGADLTLKDREGRTVLHLAAGLKDPKTIMSLLNLGLQVNQKDSKGWCAVHYAASSGTPDNLKVILPYFNRERYEETAHWTPLHIACRSNQPEALDLLLQAGFRPKSVETFHPKWVWSLCDIASACKNRKLISRDGTVKHALLNNVEVTAKCPPLVMTEGLICDGCETGHGQPTYGIQFHCNECVDFDYCFMCIVNAERTHPHHTFSEID